MFRRTVSCQVMAAFPPQVVQKLVLPFGRLNYLPLEQQFMPCLERILAREAGMAPLATVNILMSLCQLRCLPFRALHFVFSPGFINYISGARPGRLAGTLRAGGLGRAGWGPTAQQACAACLQAPRMPSLCDATSPCWTRPWSWSSQHTGVPAFPEGSKCPSSLSHSSPTVPAASTGGAARGGERTGLKEAE